METLYLICAGVGGTILIVQTILLVMGGVGGGDVDTDVGPDDLHGGDFAHEAGGGDSHHGHGDHAGQDHGGHGQAFLKLLSFKTVVAFLTFFGLAGLAGAKGGLDPTPTLLISVGAGAAALYLVGYLMSAMSKLQSKGNLDLRNAVGATAKVYLRIPASRTAPGKVLVAVQGRKVELKAVTDGPEIPTGSEVRVVGTSGEDTLEVQSTRKE